MKTIGLVSSHCEEAVIAAVDLAVRNIDQFSALVQIVWWKIFILL